ncbi:MULTISPECIES: hypothetical protein [Pseudomonas]|uniref:hypothetical protein n=1 Tax=Pseudomonas TaxID=286 RepID=UPI000C32C3B1|nr:MULTISPECIES: hypothetical protein [Pseudomonas]PWD01969.1 hypothetical protein CX658_18600 [Pseudomonas amygdali pv. lachrymans]WNZ87553.1 hypothetical protein QOM10_30165 [Pseudomonas sp. P108]
MDQLAVTAWIATLNAGDAVAVYDGIKRLFEAKVVRRTDAGMVVCKPGGTFKPNGYPHGQLAAQSQRLRPVDAEPEDQGINPDGFGFFDLLGDEWQGYINLFWKDFVLACVPPPLATEIRNALILARQNGDRTGALGVAGHMELLPSPSQPKATSPRLARRQQEFTPGKTVLIANQGTRNELTITALADGTYEIDNVYGLRGKQWMEFPRGGKSIASCKATATRIIGEPQEWVEPECSAHGDHQC